MLQRSLVAPLALLLVLFLGGPPPARAQKPATAKPKRPTPTDTLPGESAPAPLIVPPKAIPESAAVDTSGAAAKKRARTAYARGLALEREGAYAAAIISYVEAARADPTLKGPSYRVGMLFAWKRQFAPAAGAFRQELRRDPGNRAATREYALMLVELGDTVRTVRMLEELTRRAPGDAEAWRALGFAYARAGRRDAAEKALKGAIALDAKNAAAWRDLGVLYADKGEVRAARDAYQRALAIDPDEVAALINLGNLDGRLGDHQAALAHFREAERRDSTYFDAYRGQIRELVVLGREPEAGAVWKRWLAVAPDDEVREGAARHFVRQGRTDVALEIAREGVRDAPKEGEPRWLMGEMQLASGDTSAALTAYREAWLHYTKPADRARAEASIAALRSAAVGDTLRARLRADSLRYAHADTLRTKAR